MLRDLPLALGGLAVEKRRAVKALAMAGREEADMDEGILMRLYPGRRNGYEWVWRWKREDGLDRGEAWQSRRMEAAEYLCGKKWAAVNRRRVEP